MKRVTFFWLLAIAAVLAMAVGVSADAPEPEPEKTVIFCPIDGLVDDGLAVVVERAVEEAAYADAIVFVVDTYGGLVDSALNITQSIMDSPVPTIAYVRGKGAISAGAIISMACDDIVMAPATSIGGALPVAMTTQGSLPGGEKEISFLRSQIASIAGVKGHNISIAQAMVDPDIELYAARDANGEIQVWSPTVPSAMPEQTLTREEQRSALHEALDTLEEQSIIPLDPLRPLIDAIEEDLESQEEEDTVSTVEGPAFIGSEPQMILAQGKLLTMTAHEAEMYGLIRGLVESEEEVLDLFELHPAQVIHIEMTWAEQVFRFLTNPMVSGIIFMIGIAGIYIEIRTPGFGLPGIAGVLAFALFFGARYVLGLTEWIDVVLIVLGLILISVELFVIPGFGVVGVAGILCMAAGLYLTFTLEGFEWPQYQWQFDRLRDGLLTMVVAFGSFMVVSYATWKILPHTPAYGLLTLTDTQSEELGYVVQTEEDESAVGLRGEALTVLRPAGKGRFGDRTIQVVSRSEYIDQGEPIEVVAVEGNRYVVEPVKEET